MSETLGPFAERLKRRQRVVRSPRVHAFQEALIARDLDQTEKILREGLHELEGVNAYELALERGHVATALLLLRHRFPLNSIAKLSKIRSMIALEPGNILAFYEALAESGIMFQVVVDTSLQRYHTTARDRYRRILYLVMRHGEFTPLLSELPLKLRHEYDHTVITSSARPAPDAELTRMLRLGGWQPLKEPVEGATEASLLSLQQLTRITLNSTIRREEIQHLPLPQPLLEYLNYSDLSVAPVRGCYHCGYTPRDSNVFCDSCSSLGSPTPTEEQMAEFRYVHHTGGDDAGDVETAE